MENKKYWQEYYKQEQPTDFAKFCLPYIPPKSTIIDLGCGNGRDSYYFGDKEHKVLGIDYAFKPREVTNVKFFKLDLIDIIHLFQSFDIVYSRFFLHSISTKEIIDLIKWSNGLFMAEFRDKFDKPELFKDHLRNLIAGEFVKELLLKNKFEILYYGKSKGWAVYKCEDPLVVRIIAKKNVSF